MLERGMPRAPGQPARVGDYRRGPLARFGGTADPAAPGQPDVVSVRGHRIRLRDGCGLHVGGGVPSGEGTHRRHPPRGRRGVGAPPAGAGRRRAGRPVRSDDELGELAASFNTMTAEVGGVQAKIEEQVRRKTLELEKVHKTLLRSEKMASIGKLAATVAHEINNPLFGILTYARLVLRELMKHDVPQRDEMA